MWTNIDFDKLVEGDRFRLFESNGEQVVNTKGQSEWIASCSPFLNKYDDLVINVYQP